MRAIPWLVVALVAVALLGLPATASAQYGGYPGGGGYGGGGYGGGGLGGGLGGIGGFGGLGQQIPQQLAPTNLRQNYYMYDSIGGMGRTGGTIQVITQFGMQSQQGGGGIGQGGGGGYGGGYPGGGGGYGGYPGYYGVNYQRQMAQRQMAMAYQQAMMANAYRNQMYAAQAQAQLTTPAVSTSSSTPSASTVSYGSYLRTPAAPPQFSGFGSANNLGTFNPAGFDSQKKDEPTKDQEK